MKIFGFISFVVLLVSQVSIAQDSPTSADPGTPPPPQGWKVGGPENAGIHLPAKSKKQMRIKRQGLSSSTAASSTAPSIDAPAAEGEHPTIKTKKPTAQPPNL